MARGAADRGRRGLVAARIVGEQGIGKTGSCRVPARVHRPAGDIVAQTGPDPTWAEVGYYALRKRHSQARRAPRHGGVPARLGGGERRGAPRPRPTSSTSPRPRRREERAASSPDERRFAAAASACAGREALLGDQRARSAARAPRHPRDRRYPRTSTAPAATPSPTSSASRRWRPVLLVAISHARLRPGLARPSPTRRARSRGCRRAPSPSCLADAGRRSAPSLRGRAEASSPLYVDQVMRFQREQGGSRPARLADLIALRVERLPADARRVLQAAAVLGDATERRRAPGAAACRRRTSSGRSRSSGSAGMIERAPGVARRTRSCARSSSRQSPPPSAASSTRAPRDAPRPRPAPRGAGAPRVPRAGRVRRAHACSSR